jgi:hypothetical protein
MRRPRILGDNLQDKAMERLYKSSLGSFVAGFGIAD